MPYIDLKQPGNSSDSDIEIEGICCQLNFLFKHLSIGIILLCYEVKHIFDPKILLVTP